MYLGCDFRPDSVVRPPALHRDEVASLHDGLVDAVDVKRSDATEVDHLHAHAGLGQLLGGLRTSRR